MIDEIRVSKIIMVY